VTGAGIEDEVNPSLAKSVSWTPFLPPCVLADLEAEVYAVKSVRDVTSLKAFSVSFAVYYLSGYTFIEPSRFVVDAIARKILFESNAEDFLVADYAHGVVCDTVVTKRESDRDRNTFALLPDRLKLLPGSFRNPFAEEKIFASVPCDTEFGEAKKSDLLSSCFLYSLYDVGGIILPVNGSLIDTCTCYSHSLILLV
jgi:hypothetical protein